jgi:Xaa-Pro aminopeptidase
MAKLRLERLRSRMKEAGQEALLVTNPVNVTYLSGFTGTAGHLLIVEEQSWLLTDFRYLEQAAVQTAGFTVVDVAGSPWERVRELLLSGGTGSLTVEGEHLTMDVFHRLEAALKEIPLVTAPSAVSALRRIKSTAEQQAIAESVALTDRAFSHILPYIKAGVKERELALELEFFMRREGASGVSFEIIAASGARSALPHGVAGEKRLNAGDAVVLDFGCVLNGYCSDMTRTVFVGEPGGRQREIYRAVLEAQEKALEQLRAGMNGREADALARDVLSAQGLAEYFGHGLGHGLGREIHEGPRLSPASDDLLEAGMVVTVEPGVYLQGEFGVRIEDVVIIGEHGVRNLTGSTKQLLYL